MPDIPDKPAQPGLFHEDEFAEVEIDFDAPSQASAAPPQAVAPRAPDPVRERFFEMRSLAPGGGFARHDAALFYRQAKFMEDFTDDYEGGAPFSMYYPCHQQMNSEQLRTYFTWRASARRGFYTPTALSYIFVHLYELLALIGVKGPEEGLDKLASAWFALRDEEPLLDQYLPQWLRDFHIYYELPRGFADFAADYGLHNHYRYEFSERFDGDDALAQWNALSSYDIMKSVFYKDNNAALMRDAFQAVIHSLRELCAGCEMAVGDIFKLPSPRRGRASWTPFQHALFHPWLDQPDRDVRMPNGCLYECRKNQWTYYVSIPLPDRRDLAGYVLKKTESLLRQALQYRRVLHADPKNANHSLSKLNERGISIKALDAAVEKGVQQFYRELTRTVVSVDPGNLARIREEARGTRDKLIVPEDSAPVAVSAPVSPPPSPAPADDPWAALREALSPLERQALALALQGGAGVRELAAAHNVMLEVLADGINEKAADLVGDNILSGEEGMAVYDEYRGKVGGMALRGHD